MKNPNDLIGNRTCNLPACSAVPQTSGEVGHWENEKVRNKDRRGKRGEKKYMTK